MLCTKGCRAIAHNEVTGTTNKYEAIYISDTAMEEGARKELIQKFADLTAATGGAVDKVDEWGKRRLAYAIHSKGEG